MNICGLEEAGRLLAASTDILVMTGAGASAESGIPTFRGPDGLWRKHNPEDLATPQAFARDPELVWQWYHWRRGLIARCRPNPGHFALARLAEIKPGLHIVTQNVDGLHQRAGSPRVLELHGNIWKQPCTVCGRVRRAGPEDFGFEPRCPACGGLERPGVVWFGESLEPAVLDAAISACRGCQVMILAGTSSLVNPAASLAGLAKEAGAVLLEINPEKTPNSPLADYSLRGGFGKIMPALLELL